MRRLIVLPIAATVALALAGEAAAESCVSNASGNWGAAGTWTSCDGDGVPDGDDSVSIVSPHTVSVDAGRSASSLTLASGATLSFTANNPTVAVSGAFTANGGTITGNGLITVGGTFTKATAGTLSIVEAADVDLNAAGSIDDGTFCMTDSGGGDPSLQVDATLTIASTAPNGVFGCNAGADVPHVKIGAAGSIVDQRPGDTTIHSPIDNDGEIRAEAGALFLTGSTSGATSTGDYHATAGDTLFIQNHTTLGSGGALEGAGTISLNGNITVPDGADITVASLTTQFANVMISGTGAYTPGAITVSSSTINSTRDTAPLTLTFVASGTLTGDHTTTPGALDTSSNNSLGISDEADLVLNNDTTLAAGTICLTDSGGKDPSLQINAKLTLATPVAAAFGCNAGSDVPHVFVNPGGVLERSGAGSSTLFGRYLVQGGTVSVAAMQTLDFEHLSITSGAINVAGTISPDSFAVAGGTVDVDGALNGPATLTSGGVLTGTGQMTGALTNTSGVIRPGSSPGTFTVTGSYTQGALGMLELEVNGDQAGQFDVLAVSGLATLDGVVALVGPGYEPPDNDDVIQFLTSGSRSGTFADLSGGALGGGREWILDYPAGSPFGARLVIELPPTPTPGQPSVTGTPASGQVLTCDTGTWQDTNDYAFEWLRDGQVIAGATNQDYTVTDEDRGHALTCRVTGSNATGSAQATSAAVNVPAPPSGQAPTPDPDPAPAPTPAPTPTPTPTPTPEPTVPAPTTQENRLAAAAPSAVAQALGFPRRVCLSRRRFTIRLREPAGVRLASARITVAGKRVTARRVAGRMRATVDLRGLREGRYKVTIVARTVSGKTLRGTRRYRTCTLRGPSSGIPKL